MTNYLGHRLRCITVKAGVVNKCPDCGHVWVTDFCFDFSHDPNPECGAMNIDEEFVAELQEIAPTLALPCLPSCEEREGA